MEQDKYIKLQEKVCEKFFQEKDFVNLDSLIALGKNFNPDKQINGLRHPRTKNLSGWYIWSGEDFNPEEYDFFKPIHTYHLVDYAAYIIKYLGLPAGNRFLIDKNGYEDIWFDENLLITSI